jgi:hypothetical protein
MGTALVGGGTAFGGIAAAEVEGRHGISEGPEDVFAILGPQDLQGTRTIARSPPSTCIATYMIEVLTDFAR